jgi:branched-chain amino acid transport system permease protein
VTESRPSQDLEDSRAESSLGPGMGFRGKRRWILLAVLFALLPVLHEQYPHVNFALLGDRVDLHLGVHNLVLLYIALAMGLTLSIGFVGMLDLGFAAFIGIGAYTLAILSTISTLPVWWWVPVAGLVSGLARLALGATCLRLRGDYLAIVTLGFGEIFVTLLKNDPWGLTGGPDGIALSPIRMDYTDAGRYWISYGVAVAAVYAVYRIKFSRIGRAFESIREDEIAAEAMGVPVFRMKLLAYSLGGVIAGAAGAVLAVEVGSANPSNYDFFESARVVAMVVVGGTGSIFGAALGAISFVMLLEIFRPLAQYRLLIFGVVMIVVMILRPQGLFSTERRRARARRLHLPASESGL